MDFLIKNDRIDLNQLSKIPNFENLTPTDLMKIKNGIPKDFPEDSIDIFNDIGKFR